LQKKLSAAGIPTKVLAGEDALSLVASHEQVTTVMAAIVGAAGLLPTLSAVESAKKVLLANKEALIMAGELFVAALARSGSVLIPVDSEHNAIFQCLPPDARLIGSDVRKHGVRKVVLTASGGPFRELPIEQLAAVTPAQACKHPNWSMGRKISVDSASMMNKGLELIEACFLFGLNPGQIEVLIHPQSIIHSMVEYDDGSVIAQLGAADMRVPISYGLAWPARAPSGADFLDLISSGDLQFYKPDLSRFPCLELGMQAAEQGGTMPAIINAANEVAVDGFLKGLISFTDIPVIIGGVMKQIACSRADTLDTIRGADLEARFMAAEMLNRMRRPGAVK
jgi:1-deoxy-D-xylulose-5-phosphate reductoisomerase